MNTDLINMLYNITVEFFFREESSVFILKSHKNKYINMLREKYKDNMEVSILIYDIAVSTNGELYKNKIVETIKI